jgi:hypothetical protein
VKAYAEAEAAGPGAVARAGNRLDTARAPILGSTGEGPSSSTSSRVVAEG